MNYGKQLIIVGTNHEDLQGPRRLKYLLEVLSPRVIAIENEPTSERVVIENKISADDIRKSFSDAVVEAGINIEKSHIDAYVSAMEELRSVVLYEITVPRSYLTHNPETKIIDIDLPSFRVQGDLSEFRNFLRNGLVKNLKDSINSEMFLKKLSEGKESYLKFHQKLVKIGYAATERLYEGTSKKYSEIMLNGPANKDEKMITKIFSPERDNEMSKLVRTEYDKMGHGNMLVVCGAIHTVPMGSILKDLNPIVKMLDDYRELENIGIYR